MRLGDAADANQQVAYGPLLGLGLHVFLDLLPWAAAATRQIRARRHASRSTGLDYAHEIGVRVGAAILAHRDLDLVAGRDGAHEVHLAVDARHPVRPEGERFDPRSWHRQTVADGRRAATRRAAARLALAASGLPRSSHRPAAAATR